MDAIDISIQQIMATMPSCWTSVILRRVNYEPLRNSDGSPQPTSIKDCKTSDRIVLMIDGPTFLDAKVLSSDPPRNWTGRLQIIYNAANAVDYPDEDDLLAKLKPGTIIDFETLKSAIWHWIDSSNKRVGFDRF